MSAWTNWPAEFTFSRNTRFSSDFPHLHPHKCVGGVSDATRLYNCFAWAAAITNARWEPDPLFQYYWPDNIAREYTLDALVEAYRSVGFETCTDESSEPGFEKIAIYTNSGEPTHATRQLENGNWTTKFGDFEDVEHLDLDCLEGPLYGRLTRVFMRRARL